MSMARVCDRCRQLVEAERNDAMGTGILKFPDNHNVQDLDLCGKCTRIVYQFIKNGVVPKQGETK